MAELHPVYEDAIEKGDISRLKMYLQGSDQQRSHLYDRLCELANTSQPSAPGWRVCYMTEQEWQDYKD